VGRPGLDPGTLGANLEHSGPSLNVQIHWSQALGRSPTFAELLPSLISWLDEWLDKGAYSGLANVCITPYVGEVNEMFFGRD
jgi:hypothetical protein